MYPYLGMKQMSIDTYLKNFGRTQSLLRVEFDHRYLTVANHIYMVKRSEAFGVFLDELM